MTQPEVDPKSATCPNCQARPGEPCTQPTETGRKKVTWTHLSREAAAHDAR